MNQIKAFSQVYGRWNTGTSVVHSLRRVTGESTAQIEALLKQESLDYLQSLIAQDKGFITVKLTPDQTQAYLAQMADGMAKLSVQNARMAVDAASLVFAHSVLEAFVYDCLKITQTVDQDWWEHSVRNDEITLKVEQLRTLNVEPLVRKSVEKAYSRLDRMSLLVKLDTLHEICKPPLDFDPIENYRYDRERVKRIDTTRHDVVHNEILKVDFSTLPADLDYLSKTCLWCGDLMIQRFGLSIDVYQMFNT
jgi:hypothetical protein